MTITATFQTTGGTCHCVTVEHDEAVAIASATDRLPPWLTATARDSVRFGTLSGRFQYWSITAAELAAIQGVTA